MHYKISVHFFDSAEGDHLISTLKFQTDRYTFRIFNPMRFTNQENFKDYSRYLFGDYEQRFVAFLSPSRLTELERNIVGSEIIDEGELSMGAERARQMEFFLPNSEWIDGRYSFIHLDISDLKDAMTETDEVLLKDKETVWFFTTHKYQIPYIFSKRNKDFHYIPEAHSAVPLAIENDLTSHGLIYWKPDRHDEIEKAKEYVLENWNFNERDKFEFQFTPWEKK